MIEQTTEVINTKVTPWAKKMLMHICSRKGLTLYDMLKNMCDVIIRYMSRETNISPDMDRAIGMFENMDGWAGNFTLVDPDGKIEVQKAIYIVGNPAHIGERAIMVNKPFFGTWTQTCNVQEIFEQTVQTLFPNQYKRLRLLAVEMGCESMVDVIDRLVDAQMQGLDTITIRQEFEDCNRDDYGRRPTDHRYKRKLHQDIERVKSIATTQTAIHFLPDDVPPLPEIDEHGEPIKVHDDTPPIDPFGMVW